jgi:hypothetical protein
MKKVPHTDDPRGSAMVRIAAIAALGTLLVACSGSNRAEDILPAWANTPPRAGGEPAARKNRSESRTGPDGEQRSRPEAVPSEAKPPEVRNAPEE